jgi:hypothetical protein
VFAEYEYLTSYGDQIASYGGPVDLLIGRDYAPYIQTLNVLQAPSDPDKHLSIAFTTNLVVIFLVVWLNPLNHDWLQWPK